MRIKTSTILFLSSFLLLISSAGKTTALQEAIEAFHKKEKTLKKVTEEQKDLETKEWKIRTPSLLEEINQGVLLAPTAERMTSESDQQKRKKRVLKGRFTEALLNAIDQGTKLVVVNAPVQKIDWAPYNKLSLRIKEMYPELLVKAKKSQILIGEVKSKKEEYKEKKKEKETIDILIQRLTRLQTLKERNLLYPAEKREREAIIQGLELEPSEINLQALKAMLPEINKKFLEIKTFILSLEKEIHELEDELQAYKSELDTYERNTKRLFLTLEDIHSLGESDFGSEKSKSIFAKFNEVLSSLDQPVDLNGGDYILVLKDMVLSQQLLSLFFDVYQDLQNKILALEENPTFKRLTEVEKTHELAFKEDELVLHLRRKNDVKGGNLTIKQGQELEEAFSAMNQNLQKLTETDFYRDAQGFFDYRLVFKNTKLDIHSPAPFKIKRLKKIHEFLIYHGKNTLDDLSDYSTDDELKTSQELAFVDFIEDDYLVNSDGQQMAGNIVLSRRQPPEDQNIDLLASMVILEASSIGLNPQIKVAQQMDNEDEKDQERGASTEGSSPHEKITTWYILKFLGFQ